MNRPALLIVGLALFLIGLGVGVRMTPEAQRIVIERHVSVDFKCDAVYVKPLNPILPSGWQPNPKTIDLLEKAEAKAEAK